MATSRYTSQSAGSFTVDTSNLKALGKAFLNLGGVQARRELRVFLKEIGDIVSKRAKDNASQFSTRIPGSIQTLVSPTGFSVKIRAGGPGGAKAPNAAPIEAQGKGHVRHPIPNTDQWTSKNSPPAFLGPAVDASEAEITAATEALADKLIAFLEKS